MKKTVLAIAFLLLLSLFLPHPSAAQIQSTSPPPPSLNPADMRFKDVEEDWSSPALRGSNLHLSQPLVGYINDHSGYTVELLQVQWRPCDPLDLYVMKPKGVEK